MSLALLAYPFLFITIFFEAFVLVTLLSKPARAARTRIFRGDAPTVAIIVPCYNEAATVAATCASLLALDYPKEKLEIILVDDGSTDDTRAAMERFASSPSVRVIYKENGGKHTALNAGLAQTQAQFVGCLDADSFVESDALRKILPCFENQRVVAATAAMSVNRPKNLLQHMQNAEYIFGIAFRHAIASVNGLYVTPGPFSFYRRSVFDELGGFRHGYQTEDMEMALRIQRAGYEIANAPHAGVYTNAPRTVPGLLKQRTRWTSGFLRNVLRDYRDFLFNPRRGALGMLVLPIALFAIGSGIALFSIAVVKTAAQVIETLEVRAGIPLSYALLPHHPYGLFYLPASFSVLLATVAMLGVLFMIVFGKRISKAPGSLGLGLFSYALMYGFVVPLWLMRATADVALGRNRTWR